MNIRGTLSWRPIKHLHQTLSLHCKLQILHGSFIIYRDKNTVCNMLQELYVRLTALNLKRKTELKLNRYYSPLDIYHINKTIWQFAKLLIQPWYKCFQGFLYLMNMNKGSGSDRGSKCCTSTVAGTARTWCHNSISLSNKLEATTSARDRHTGVCNFLNLISQKHCFSCY